MRELMGNVVDGSDIMSVINDLRDDRKDIIDEINAAITSLVMFGYSEHVATAVEELITLDKLKEHISCDDAWLLDNLEELASDCSACPDWPNGTVLIKEDYFTKYIEEQAYDIGTVTRKDAESLNIDWDAAAERARIDYMSVDYDGVTYLTRA